MTAKQKKTLTMLAMWAGVAALGVAVYRAYSVSSKSGGATSFMDALKSSLSVTFNPQA